MPDLSAVMTEKAAIIAAVVLVLFILQAGARQLGRLVAKRDARRAAAMRCQKLLIKARRATIKRSRHDSSPAFAIRELRSVMAQHGLTIADLDEYASEEELERLGRDHSHVSPDGSDADPMELTPTARAAPKLKPYVTCLADAIPTRPEAPIPKRRADASS